MPKKNHAARELNTMNIDKRLPGLVRSHAARQTQRLCKAVSMQDVWNYAMIKYLREQGEIGKEDKAWPLKL